MDGITRKRLAEIATRHNNGERFIFAPNHLAPEASWRVQSAFADDFPVFQKVLREECGIADHENTPVFRGDTDIEIGDSIIKKYLYHIHRTLFSHLGKKVLGGGVPVAINQEEPQICMSHNVSTLLTLIQQLKQGETHLSIYSYGKWFHSKEQQFLLEDMDMLFTHNPTPRDESFARWRNGLKRGTFVLAQHSGASIIPIYMENNNGCWKMGVGEFLRVAKSDTSIGEMKHNITTAAAQYLAEMRTLRGS